MKKREPVKRITKKTAKFRYYPGSVVKHYRAKYYNQRLRCNSPGEPWILDHYKSEFFVPVKRMQYNPLRTCEFLRHEPKLTDAYNEFVEFELLDFDMTHSKAQGPRLAASLAGFLEALPGELRRVGIRHRDIQAPHVMWSGNYRRWFLLDFAIAVPIEDPLHKNEKSGVIRSDEDCCRRLLERFRGS